MDIPTDIMPEQVEPTTDQPQQGPQVTVECTLTDCVYNTGDGMCEANIPISIVQAGDMAHCSTYTPMDEGGTPEEGGPPVDEPPLESEPAIPSSSNASPFQVPSRVPMRGRVPPAPVR